MPVRLFVAVALVFGAAYALLTPPLQVPDEVAHFWRGVAIGTGQTLLPARRPAVQLPVGAKTFVWLMSDGPPDAMRIASETPMSWRDRVTPPRFMTVYTPLPYAAPALVVVLCRIVNARAIVVFYAGRLANLLAAVALIACAMVIAPAYRTMFAAVALLPMSLFELASWSADAATLAVAIAFTAMLLAPERTRGWMPVAAAAALGACKPGYFLLALLALVAPMPRRRAWAIVAAAVLATLLSAAWARASWFNMKSGEPVDPAAQLRCIREAPLTYAGALLHDVRARGTEYLEQMIGRLGRMDVQLPRGVRWLELAVLLLAGVAVPLRMRIAAALIIIGTIALVMTSQYLNWSPVCGDEILGVQGRYFLPVLPTALTAIGIKTPPRAVPWIVLAAAVIANIAALLAIIDRYY